MASPAVVYTPAAASLAVALTPWTGGSDVVAILLTSAYTPSVGHAHVSDLTGELSGGSYSRAIISSRSTTLDAASHRRWFLGSAAVFASLDPSAGTPRTLVLASSTGTDSTSPVLAYVDLGAGVTLDGRDLAVTPPSTGWFYRAEIADDFTRPDSSSSPGGDWVVTGGTAGISSGKMVLVAEPSGYCNLALPTGGITDGEFSFTFPDAPDAVIYMCFRATSTLSDWWAIVIETNTAIHFQAHSIDYASTGATGSGHFFPAAGDHIRIVFSGTSVQIYRNGAIASGYNYPSSSIPGSHVGFSFNSLVGSIDDLRVIGPWGADAPTVALVLTATALPSRWTPGRDAGQVELDDVVSVRWTMMDPLVGPDPTTFVLLDGGPSGDALATTPIDRGGGVWDASAPLDFIQDVVYTITARLQTTDGTWNETTWSFTVRIEDGAFVVRASGFTVRKPVVDARTVVPVVERVAPIDWRVSLVAERSGLVAATDFPVDLQVNPARRFQDFEAIPLDAIVSKLRDYIALPVAGDIGELHHGGVPVAVDVEGDIENWAAAVAADVSGEMQVVAVPVAADVSEPKQLPALPVAGDVGRVGSSSLPAAADVRGASTKGEIVADLIPEDLYGVIT